jgi:hypothetical protein
MLLSLDPALGRIDPEISGRSYQASPVRGKFGPKASISLEKPMSFASGSARDLVGTHARPEARSPVHPLAPYGGGRWGAIARAVVEGADGRAISMCDWIASKLLVPGREAAGEVVRGWESSVTRNGVDA